LKMISRDDKKRPELCKEVLKKIADQNIKYVWLQFTDLNGIPKSYGVRASEIESFLEIGDGFDGSSITGFGRIEESDMVAIPDPSTFAVIPWRAADHNVGRFICDVFTPEDKPYEGDPRFILQKAIKKMSEAGLTYKCAPELEFFWLKPTGEATPKESDFRGYFDADPGDENQLMRREVAQYAESFNIEVEAMHHEVAKSQHEIDIKYGSAADMADATITMKQLVKVVGTRHGYVGTFLAKPFVGHNGSGMHVHQSVWKNNENMMFDASDPNKISNTLRYFIGGQLKHAKAFCSITSSWPNSYKRLVPGYEAPTYVAWGFKNRSMMIRVPNFQGKKNAARCEIRCPDPSGNPYLQFAVLMMAGLDGIKNKIDPPAPVELNIFHVDKAEQERLGVENLPGDLGQALTNTENSKFIKEVLGEQAFHNYIEIKRQEFQLYSAQVSEWEIKRYTPIL
jgi:glutamine synthetase